MQYLCTGRNNVISVMCVHNMVFTFQLKVLTDCSSQYWYIPFSVSYQHLRGRVNSWYFWEKWYKSS